MTVTANMTSDATDTGGVSAVDAIIIGVVLGCIAFILIIALGCVGIIIWVCIRKRSRAKKKEEEETLLGKLKALLREHSYTEIEPLGDIGGRKSKTWFTATNSDGNEVLLSYIPVTPLCKSKLNLNLPQKATKQEGAKQEAMDKGATVASSEDVAIIMESESDIETLNSLLNKLLEHPNIFPVEKVLYVPDPKGDHFLIVQPLVSEGSLKDKIYGESFRKEWDQKYNTKGTPLTRDEIKSYGRQILEVLQYLYDLGFPPLGHVQSGNVFVEGVKPTSVRDQNKTKRCNLLCCYRSDADDSNANADTGANADTTSDLSDTAANENVVCRLGGYELRLLSYNTRLYKLFKDYTPEQIDVLMFGHLMFEMAAGYELTTTEPTEEDYDKVRDEELLEALKLIFGASDDGHEASSEKRKRKLWQRKTEKPEMKSGKKYPKVGEVLEFSFFKPDNGQETQATPIGLVISEDAKELLLKFTPKEPQPQPKKKKEKCVVS